VEAAYDYKQVSAQLGCYMVDVDASS